METEWTLEEISNWAKHHSQVQIPAIQRGLVWKPEQVELLWDSILRRFPIGAFILSHSTTNDGERFYLMDGQQRWNAIAAGYGALSNQDCILWFDLKPDKEKWEKSKTTRKYFIRTTTKAHPWGYKANDDCSRLNTREKREALYEFGLEKDQYKDGISLSETYPIESGFPVPLHWMIKAAEMHREDRDGFARCVMGKIRENEKSCVFKLKKVEDINDSLISKYYDTFRDLRHYKVPAIYIDQKTIDHESGDPESGDKANADPSGIEILFNRIGTGGTPITELELMYSSVKAYWPELVEENDRLAKLYMPPQALISLAFRLVLSSAENDLGRVPSVRKIRQLALKDKGVRAKIDELYSTDGCESVMSRILSTVDKWLTDRDENGNRGIHPVLRTSIARKSPEVYLLMMIFAQREKEGKMHFTPKEEELFRAVAYYLHWMVNDKYKATNSIYKALKQDESNMYGENIKQVLLGLCIQEAVIPLLSPGEFKNLFTIEGDKKWRPGGNGRSSMPWWPLWKSVTDNREVLLYAQREYMCKNFPNYDPARQDLWEQHNRPWDFDHIIPQDWIHKKGKWKQTYTDYCEAWKNNNGNMAAIPFWENRTKSNEPKWDEYIKHAKELLADDQISDFHNLFNAKKLQCDGTQAKTFAEKTYGRMCKIYDEIYNLLKPIDFRRGEVAFTKETIKERIEKMTAVRNRLKDDGYSAGIYYLHNKIEYPQEYIDDWAREWMSCGCIVNGYYAAFTIQLDQKGDFVNLEIGLRRLPQKAELSGKVTDEQFKKLEGNNKYERYENNTWWHLCREKLDIDTANEKIINEIKTLADFASKHLQ